MIKHTNRVIETALCRLSTASTRTKNRKEDPWLPEWQRWSNYKIAALPKPAPRCAEGSTGSALEVPTELRGPR